MQGAEIVKAEEFKYNHPKKWSVHKRGEEERAGRVEQVETRVRDDV